jgi:hypothetical protein
MHQLQLNYLAIFVSAVIQWIIGAIWYSPILFAKPWMALIPTVPDKKSKSMIAGMISSFIGSLILSFVLAHIVFWSGVTSFWNGALMGLVVWCGFVASPGFAQGIYEGRPFKLFAINTGYWLVALVVSGGMLAIWH